MEKNYCDKCKKVDKDCGVLIYLTARVFRYIGLGADITSEEEAERRYVKSKEVTLCADCYTGFFRYLESKPQE